MRGSLIVANVLFLAFGAVIIGVGVYALTSHTLNVLGTELAERAPIAYIVMGGVLVVGSLLGIISAKTTGKCWLFLYSILMFCVFAVLVGVSIFIFVIGGKIKVDDSYWVNKISDLWQTAVRESASVVCEFMNTFQCSGFWQSCNSYTSASEQAANCPTSCTDLWDKPGCYAEAKDEIILRFNVVASVSIVCSFVIGIGLIFAIALCGYSRKERKNYV